LTVVPFAVISPFAMLGSRAEFGEDFLEFVDGDDDPNTQDRETDSFDAQRDPIHSASFAR
jgi:hypothetical protein